jgi:hypothetical protein
VDFIKPLKGTRSVVAERAASGFFLDVDFNRQALASFGMSLKEAQDQAMMMIGGENVSTSLNSRERFPIQVRLNQSSRNDIDSIKKIPLKNSSGALIQLREIANVSIKEAPGMIRNENAMPVAYVFVDVDLNKTDIGSFVSHGKKELESKLKIPSGYTISWSGQFENMIRVKERLKVVIPITLLLIAFLLFFNTKSWIKTGIAGILVAIYWWVKTTALMLSGAAWPLFCIGAMQLVVGLVVYLRTDKQVVSLEALAHESPDAFRIEELDRMHHVSQNFIRIRWIEIALFILSGIMIMMFFPLKGFWFGFGIALAFESALSLTLDFFAEERADHYKEFVKRVG